MSNAFHSSPCLGSLTERKITAIPTRLIAAQAMNGNWLETASYRKPPRVEPTTKPAFWKLLKMPMLFPRFAVGIRLENTAMREGFVAPRPTPLSIMTRSRNQNPPDMTTRTAENASMTLPNVRVVFLPTLSEIAPIGKVVIMLVIPMTVKSIPTSVTDTPNSSLAKTESMGCIKECEEEVMKPTIHRPMKARG